jgi:hypothetical protein
MVEKLKRWTPKKQFRIVVRYRYYPQTRRITSGWVACRVCGLYMPERAKRRHARYGGKMCEILKKL